MYKKRIFTALLIVMAALAGCILLNTSKVYVSAASTITTIKTSTSQTAITVKWSGVKKSKIKGAQIKYAANKSLKGAKTIKLNKTKAKKMSYKFTVSSKKISKGTTYYFKVRVKTGSKWSKWSAVKSAKVASKSKKDEKEEDWVEKLKADHKCKHTLAAGETSEIVVVGDSKNYYVFDVHTCTATGKEYNDLFKVYLRNKPKEVNFNSIDYSKVSYIFDDGNTPGELWDWLPHDFCGYDGLIYSVPNYKTAMADVFRVADYSYGDAFKIREEIVPHDYNGSYKVSVLYDGKVLGSQTRTCNACINKGIKLFKDYGGEEYVKNIEGTRHPEVPRNVSKAAAIDLWQDATFCYYGCQFGTVLENTIYRYYTGEHTAAADGIPFTFDQEWVTNLNEVGSPYGAYSLYGVRYKQIGNYMAAHTHGFGIQYLSDLQCWELNGNTGSTKAYNDPNYAKMPYTDYLIPVYE